MTFESGAARKKVTDLRKYNVETETSDVRIKCNPSQ